MKKQISFFLALALLLTSCGGGSGAAAATMHLRKTMGSVGVADGEGKAIEPRENLGLYSGYGVDTQAESYAWIDLDKVKLTKLDQDSEVAITKEDNKLEIEVKAGSLFFNVTEPLADNESMNIRTSNMVVGIRGTCGWVTPDTAALLEGTVEVTAGEQSVTITAGEMAVITAEGEITVSKFTGLDIPVFTMEEIENNEELAEQIKENLDLEPVAGVLPKSRPARWTHYGADGSFSGRADCAYDEQGGRTDTSYAWKWDTQEWEYFGDNRYVYNAQGREQEIWYYTAEGELDLHYALIENTDDHATYENDSHETYTDYYNEQGQMIRTDHTGGGYSLYQYDSQGRCVQEDIYMADETYAAYTVFEYES